MKEKMGFWRSLEKYLARAGAKSPLPWSYVGLGLGLMVLIISGLERKNSMAGASDFREATRLAVRSGDDSTAQALWEKYLLSEQSSEVLGAESELEDLVYPERKVEQRIEELKSLLQNYPGHRDILIEIAQLYREIGREEAATEYWEQARVLDPNNPIFQP